MADDIDTPGAIAAADTTMADPQDDFGSDGNGGISATADPDGYDTSALTGISTPTLGDATAGFTTDTGLLSIPSLTATGVAATSSGASSGNAFEDGLAGLLGDAAGVAAQLYVQPALAASALKSQTAATTAANQAALAQQAGLDSLTLQTAEGQASIYQGYFIWILIALAAYFIFEKEL